ncbi:MAG TPA: serine hydrolase [Candidatus Paceibacterota bacterium]|nr:serine hydrolase [Candidatus Paceibacterota bacterium]
MKISAKKNNLFREVIFWIIFFIGIFLIYYGKNFSLYEKLNSSLLDETQLKLDGLILKLPPFKENISAVSWLVGEIDSGKILLKKNENFHFFPASLSKLMTAILVLDNIDLDEVVTISDYAISAEGEEGNLKAGEKITVKNLVEMLLISSSNDAAIALEETLAKKGFDFLSLTEEKLKQLKMADTAIFDSTGLDRRGNFSTTSDLFLLTREIYKNYPLIGQITRQAQKEIFSTDFKTSHLLKNTNELVLKIDNLWGGKTGSTPIAKDCLLTIYEFTLPEKGDKIPIAIIVLNSSDRFNDTLKLYQWVSTVISQSFSK